MRAIDTPLGPVRLAAAPIGSPPARQSRIRARRLLDALLVAVVFGFVGTTLLFGTPGATPTVSVVAAGVE